MCVIKHKTFIDVKMMLTKLTFESELQMSNITCYMLEKINFIANLQSCHSDTNFAMSFEHL